MRKAVSPVKFRLYPEPRIAGSGTRATNRLYVLVKVWPTARAMRAYARRSGDADSAGRNVHGYCANYRIIDYRKAKPRTKPMFAEVNMYRGKLTMECIAHELLHATIQWARRVKFDFWRLDATDSVNADEERFVYAHGRLCRQFMSRAIDAGLYRAKLLSSPGRA